MSDEPIFDFLPWEELPVGVRRNRKKMYNYLVGVLNGGEPGPTPPGPTGTGTVTVTCQRYNEIDQDYVRVSGCAVLICTELPPSEQTIVADAESNAEGVATLTDVPYGNYKLFAIDGTDTYTYSGTLTVDGNETVTITLTSE